MSKATVLFILLWCSTVWSDQHLRIITVTEPPASYLDSHGQLTGYAMDMVKAIQKSLNDHTQIEVMPEARAIHIARTQPNVLLFSFSRTAKREDEFYWISHLSTKSWVLYSNSENPLEISNEQQLRNVRSIGVVRGDIREEWLRAKGFNNLQSSVDHKQNINRLRSGRLDLIAYESQGIAHLLWEAGIDKDDIKPVFLLHTSEVYLLMSKSGTDPQRAEQWRQAAEKLKLGGQQQLLAEKWQQILWQYHNIKTETKDGVLIF